MSDGALESSTIRLKVGRFAAMLLALTIKAYARTLDSRICSYQAGVDSALEDFQGPYLYLFWHEYILLPAATRRGSNLTLLVGQHRDATLFNDLAVQFGFRTVRGSSSRGGIKAVLKYMKEHRDTSLVVTPDGPRGPRRVLSAGSVQLAAIIGLPIIAVGCGFDDPWRSPTWDRFAIPRPNTRARLLLSHPICIPRRLSADDVEMQRDRVQKILDAITLEAEMWAMDGATRIGERGLFAAPQATAVLQRSYLEMP